MYVFRETKLWKVEKKLRKIKARKSGTRKLQNQEINYKNKDNNNRENI